MMIMAKLKYLVIHCTATPEGREVSSADIRKWHTSPVAQGGRGWKQVGYTDLFHLNGGVERLVENNEDAQVDPWEVTNGAKGYNSVSRHIVYAGGVEKDGKTPKDTRTGCQKKALPPGYPDRHAPYCVHRIFDNPPEALCRLSSPDRTDRTYNYSIFHLAFRRAPDSSQAHADNILPEPGMLWKEAPDQSPSR